VFNHGIGKFVELPPEAEEVAGFYGALLETEHAQDNVFNKNFFNDWLDVLKQHPPVRFHLCLFQQFSYIAPERWN
jgi:DNA topoisomerase IB